MVPLDDSYLPDARYGLGGSGTSLRLSPTQDEIIPTVPGGMLRLTVIYYALPYMRSTEACYINKTYVEKLGYTLPDTLTWDFHMGGFRGRHEEGCEMAFTP